MSSSRFFQTTGDITISESSNPGSAGKGVLYTNFIKETSLSAGISIEDTTLKFTDSGQGTQTSLVYSLGNFNIVNGNINGTTSITSQSISLEGNLNIIGTTTISNSLNALSGLHFLQNNTSSENVLRLKNSSISGYSSIQIFDDTDTERISFGVGNTVSTLFSSSAFLHIKNGFDFKMRMTSSDAFIVNSNGTIEIINTSGGALKIAGGVEISNPTPSTSPTTGALVVSGGVGISGALNVNGNLTVDGTINIAGISGLSHNVLLDLDVDDHLQYLLLPGRTGGQVITGGTASQNNLTLNSTSNFTKGSVLIPETTASTSPDSGALVVSGGVGIAGALFAGGITRLINTTASTSTTTGALTVSGGVGIGGNLYTGGIARFTDTTASTSPDSGALTVSGGVGIAGAITIGYSGGGSSNPAVNLQRSNGSVIPLMFITGLDFDAVIVLSNLSNSLGRINFDSGAGGVYFSFGRTISTTTSVLATTSTQQATSTTNGSLRAAGGAGIVGNLYVGGLARFTNTTPSTSATAGALVVSGGVGIGGSISLSGHIDNAPIISPGNPDSTTIRYFTDDSDSLLKSKNSSGTLTTYQPTTTKGDLLTHDGTTQKRMQVDTVNDSYLVSNSSVPLGLSWFNKAFSYIRDEKPQGSNGGDATSGSFFDKELNNITSYPPGQIFISLNSATGRITLHPGNYYIQGSSPATAVGNHCCRLFDWTDNVIICSGTSERTSGGGNVGNQSCSSSKVSCIISVITPKVIGIQHIVGTTQNTIGRGAASGFQVEVYTTVMVYKI